MTAQLLTVFLVITTGCIAGFMLVILTNAIVGAILRAKPGRRRQRWYKNISLLCNCALIPLTIIAILCAWAYVECMKVMLSGLL